jgi:cytochrome P450 family 619
METTSSRSRKGQHDLYVGLLRKNKARYAKGIRVNCLMDRLLSGEGQEKHQMDEEHLAYVGGVMLEAGSDSTSATLLSFVLAMLKYPEVLKKAQDEVDRVCGDSRSPNFGDMPQLQYINACVLEVGSSPPHLCST